MKKKNVGAVGALVPVGVKIRVGVVGGAVVIEPVVDFKCVVCRRKSTDGSSPARPIAHVVIDVTERPGRRPAADNFVGHPVERIVLPAESPARPTDVINQVRPMARGSELVSEVTPLSAVQ